MGWGSALRRPAIFLDDKRADFAFGEVSETLARPDLRDRAEIMSLGVSGATSLASTASL
jgi:hypothetical protein